MLAQGVQLLPLFPNLHWRNSFLPQSIPLSRLALNDKPPVLVGSPSALLLVDLEDDHPAWTSLTAWAKDGQQWCG